MNHEGYFVVIEDDEHIINIMASFAEIAGKDMVSYQHLDDMDMAILKDAEVIFLDLHLDEEYGLDALKVLGENTVSTPIIICSGMDSSIISASEDLMSEYGLTCTGVLCKPFTLNQFLRTLMPNPDSPKTLPNGAQRPYQLTYQDIRDAIDNEWIEVVYQPQINPITESLTGVECLARVRHPQHGFCAPAQFIEQVAKFGLMEPFTQQVITQGIDALTSSNFPQEGVVSFNLDPRCINEAFMLWLDKFISTSGFAAARICLEVTELTSLDLNREVKAFLTKLRIRGVHLSLDDFGTGFGTIQELNELPFDELKIDRSFVMSMENRETSLAIVSSTVELASGLNYRLIAEGVENKKQTEMLLDFGCQEMQGYYFSKPLHLNDLSIFIENLTEEIQHKMQFLIGEPKTANGDLV